MTRRMYWGIVILMILLIGASVFMLTRTTDTDEPEKEYVYREPSKPGQQSDKKLSETGKFTEWLENERDSSDETQETDYEWQKLSGPELLELVSNMSQSEVDAMSSTEREALQQASQEAFDALSPAQQDLVTQTSRAAYWKSIGLDPPPPGYTYGQNQDGYYLVKYGEPHFRVTWDNYQYGNDYLLSDTEWEEYKALRVIKEKKLGNRQHEAPPEIVALAKEWHDQLREKTWGPIPGLSSSTHWKGNVTQADFERDDQLAIEKFNSLIPPPRSGVIDYTVVDRLLIELKSELERR